MKKDRLVVSIVRAILQLALRRKKLAILSGVFILGALTVATRHRKNARDY